MRRAAADAEKGDDALLVHDDDHANRTPFTARVERGDDRSARQRGAADGQPAAFHFFDPATGASLAYDAAVAVA